MPLVVRASLFSAFVAIACKPTDGASSTPTEPTAPPAATPPAQVCGARADGSRHFRVLHINDVYRIEGLADGRGGLARVRTLRAQLEADCDAVLLTHAGDTLYPSLLSREYDGAQMIEVLNLLDGDAAAFDERMVATFGNHEFDKDKMKDAAQLATRIADSQFAWLGTNVSFRAGEDGAPLIGGDNVVRSRVLELGGVKVGLFSLMVDSHVPEYVEQINTDYVGVAKAAVAELRGQGAEVVLALTHLDARDDRKLLTELAGAAGPDMILGGHDHVLMTVEANGRLAIKGDADALRVRVVDMWVDKDGKVGWESDPSGVALGPEAPADDPAVAKVVEARLSEFEAKFCGEAGPGCLSKNLTVATTELIAEELEIRRYETNFADYIVDQMLTSFAADGAQLAFINSGALRLNQNIAAGTKISRQLIEETFAYPAPMQLIEIKGAVLQQVVDHAIEDWTGSGHWLQIGGFAFRHDVEAGKATGLTLLGPDGPTPIDPKKKYKVVTTEFLLDKSIGNQDGYKMLSKKQVIKSKAAGTDLKQVVLKALEAAGEQGVGPERDGRICSSDRASGACLAAK